MNRIAALAVLVFAALAFASAAPGATYVAAAGPQAGPVWVPGHWEWNGASNTWVAGYYIQGQAAPAVAVQQQPLWLPAHWENTASGQVYVAGRWVEAAPETQSAAAPQPAAPAQQVVYAQQPAPQQQVVYAPQPAPQVVYVQQPAPQTVYVEQEPRSSVSWGFSLGLPLFYGGYGHGYGCTPYRGGFRGGWSVGLGVHGR